MAGHAKITAYQTFKQLEELLLKPAGWVRYHEVQVSAFEDRPGGVWRVLRMYTNPGDKDRGGLIAVKSQVTRESTPFIILYQETEVLR